MIQPENAKRLLLITGGAGFIGSNLIIYLLNKYPEYKIVNLDSLTYAGNLINLREIENAPNYTFVKGDLLDSKLIAELFKEHRFDGVINLAAQTHVDRSIIYPSDFFESNLRGTFNLLEIVRKYADRGDSIRFHQVSTDEVFGSLDKGSAFTELSRYNPSSPYAASKASADHFVRAYFTTYGLDVVLSNSCNNFGPFQFPEKLIPLMIYNGFQGKPLPVYGDGLQTRDWLYVLDHCRAMDTIFHLGRRGQSYNVGAGWQVKNIDLVHKICDLLDKLGSSGGHHDLITFVEDRPGHDRRYAVDATRLRSELGWKPQFDFEQSLEETVKWYLSNQDWIESCLIGDYLEYYDKWYGKRLRDK